jgi:hypothetical protein
MAGSSPAATGLGIGPQGPQPKGEILLLIQTSENN